MILFELIFMSAMACMFYVFAWLFLKKQRITLIHDYHYTHVRKADVAAYTRLYGYAMISIGTGILSVGVVNGITHTQWGWAGFVLLFFVGIGIIIKAQTKYNRT